MGRHVFISYKSDERLNAIELRTELEKRGLSCWMDESGIFIGENYASVISAAIDNSFAVIIVLSRKAVNSIHVQSEINMAVRHNLPVFGFAIEDFDPFVEYNFSVPLDSRYEAYENKEFAYNSLAERLTTVRDSFKSSIEDIRLFLKKRRRYLNQKRAKKGKIPVLKRLMAFFVNLMPYSQEYSKEANVRLSLNILTVFSSLAAVVTGLYGYGNFLSQHWDLSYLGIVIGILLCFLAFIASEIISGFICRLIGKIKNKIAVVILSVIVGYNMTNLMCTILIFLFFKRF